MGKAWQAPKHTGSFRYHITTHALQRFRERVEDTHRHRPDEDIARLLDERIKGAMDSKSFFEVVDSDRPDVTTTVVVLETYGTDDRPHVVMRPHRIQLGTKSAGSAMYGPSQNALSAITVLTSEMASKSLAKRSWVTLNRETRPMPPPPSLVARPFAGLDIKPADIKPADIKPPEPEPEPVKPAEPARLSWLPGTAEEAAASEALRRRGGRPFTEAGAKTSQILLALPKDWKMPQHREERREWARAYFMENPTATIKEAHRAATDKYGVGVNGGDLSAIKDEVMAYLTRIGREAIAGAAAEAAAEPPTLIAAPLRPPTFPATSATLAQRTAQAQARAIADAETRAGFAAQIHAAEAQRAAAARAEAHAAVQPAERDATAIAIEYGAAVKAERAAAAAANEATGVLERAVLAYDEAKARRAALLAELTGAES